MKIDAGPNYRRALALLAGRERQTDPLAYVTRAARRVCGALIAVIMQVSSADATLDVTHSAGPSARTVGRQLAALGSAQLVAALHRVEVAGYRVRIASISTPAGAVGALAVAVRAPAQFSPRHRQDFRALADVASVALQLRGLRNPPRAPGHERRSLNRREREVVTLLLTGASVKEAAARLGLSPRTVETYLQRLKARERQPRLHALLAQLVRDGKI